MNSRDGTPIISPPSANHLKNVRMKIFSFINQQKQIENGLAPAEIFEDHRHHHSKSKNSSSHELNGVKHVDHHKAPRTPMVGHRRSPHQNRGHLALVTPQAARRRPNLRPINDFH